ncbi:16S rRNA (guanine(527)-N(7))-methyltransferase RsmG [Geoalkalibacter sp.]|uniref:16S rRNA (guanine(527)-N(7))-methyltransferase RsmG n=1 Tax=Geoalkalibacter sp. TaxID=3041440 RepID=UPI00272EA8BA|nr:16S rRNA (guanine(527)-N(7))-methyltransferase RsmG [Geoalkalibacter sp.]
MDELGRLRRCLKDLGLEVSPDAEAQLLAFQRELLAWNRKFNLTAIRDPLESVEKHLADSLTPLPLLRSAKRLLDLGSGAGLPALPLKIARPELSVVSLDSQEKKILFQRHVARKLGLRDFHAVCARIEDFAADSAQRGAYSLVIARALASLEQLLAWAAPFLAEDGRFIAMKAQEEDGDAALLAPRFGFRLVGEEELRLPVSGARRRLQVFAPAP